eukprot:GSMAST32.ASY1.ANO1.2821.1 assembled CDS
MPQKKFFRSRAHCNPLSYNDSFEYPQTPEEIKLSTFDMATEITIADIGCGFGGLTIALGPLFPKELIVGMEIRLKVCEYVRLRIESLRSSSNPESECTKGGYRNVAVLRSNTMKYLPCYFRKAQLKKMFFCFPDPCFKKKKHRRRIISDNLLSEYAYVLKPGGLLYTITDVLELHNWMKSALVRHPSFEQLTQEEIDADKVVPVVKTCTEEGIKVARNGGSKFLTVFRRKNVSVNNAECMDINSFWGK